MTPRARSVRGEGAQLRDDVIDAAETLLLETGSDDAVSIRAVAEVVGVTAPSIYRHFAGKYELIRAVCEKQFAAFNEITAHAIEGANNPLDELRARGEAYIRFGLEHPEAYTVMFMRPPVLAGGKGKMHEKPQAYMSLVGSVERTIESGELLDVDPDHAAQVIWATVHGLTSLLISNPTFPWSDEQQLIDDALYAAVAPFTA